LVSAGFLYSVKQHRSFAHEIHELSYGDSVGALTFVTCLFTCRECFLACLDVIDHRNSISLHLLTKRSQSTGFTHEQGVRAPALHAARGSID
jgi:hypothetical protein